MHDRMFRKCFDMHAFDVALFCMPCVRLGPMQLAPGNSRREGVGQAEQDGAGACVETTHHPSLRVILPAPNSKQIVLQEQTCAVHHSNEKLCDGKYSRWEWVSYHMTRTPALQKQYLKGLVFDVASTDTLC